MSRNIQEFVAKTVSTFLDEHSFSTLLSQLDPQDPTDILNDLMTKYRCTIRKQLANIYCMCESDPEQYKLEYREDREEPWTVVLKSEDDDGFYCNHCTIMGFVDIKEYLLLGEYEDFGTKVIDRDNTVIGELQGPTFVSRSGGKKHSIIFRTSFNYG